MANIETPPTLVDLAHEVGLNDFKLKCGFKEVFGTTVFGLLHEERMARARQLLEAGRASVTQATAVGYSNPSHFAAAFRRKFGVLPSALRRAAYPRSSITIA